jgi:hypothetical protein
LQSLLTQIQTSIAIHYKAWSDIYSWSCPPIGSLKLNFDVAVRNSFMVAAADITDHDGIILSAVARRLPSLNVNAGDVNAALRAFLAASLPFPSIFPTCKEQNYFLLPYEKIPHNSFSLPFPISLKY